MKTPSEYRAFSVPKRGNAEHENEDRCAPPSQRRGRKFTALALSDGATEAAFSQEWAQVLVHSRWRDVLRAGMYHQSGQVLDAAVANWLDEARRAFADCTTNEHLPWYARAKARRGSFATFLGLRISRWRWSALSCGDTCLFHVSDGRIATSFPMDTGDAFDNQPMLVHSNPEHPLPHLSIRCHQRWEPGDTFVLATDALAAWLMGDSGGGQRIARLLECIDDRGFADLVVTERAAGLLKNDDTTAMIYRG